MVLPTATSDFQDGPGPPIATHGARTVPKWKTCCVASMWVCNNSQGSCGYCMCGCEGVILMMSLVKPSPPKTSGMEMSSSIFELGCTPSSAPWKWSRLHWLAQGHGSWWWSWETWLADQICPQGFGHPKIFLHGLASSASIWFILFFYYSLPSGE